VHLESGEEQEVLPWLKLTVELDPHNVEAFAFTAYWLRTRLGKVEEAEQFLRDGLRANSDSFEIYYELGQLYLRARANSKRAGTLFEIALRKWDQLEAGKDKEERDDVSLREILGGLTRVDEALGDYDGAIAAFQRLKTVSPQPESIQKQIDELQARRKAAADAVSPR
jgi:tetratricopeptide (TPR) repeat protein